MEKTYPSGAEMWEKSKDLKAFVKRMLEIRPGTRGDDRILAYYVWRYYDEVDIQNGITIEKIRRCTDCGTIRRRRQECQNQFPELLPTERVQAKRAAREEAIHDYYSGGYSLQDFV